MRILYIHNDYAKPSGEETAAEAIVALLQEHGHEVAWHRRSSAEIAGSTLGQMKSLFTGLANPCEAKAVARHVREFKPDIVQVQNVYPLLSSSIFPAIKKMGVPIAILGLAGKGAHSANERLPLASMQETADFFVQYVNKEF